MKTINIKSLVFLAGLLTVINLHAQQSSPYYEIKDQFTGTVNNQFDSVFIEVCVLHNVDVNSLDSIKVVWKKETYSYNVNKKSGEDGEKYAVKDNTLMIPFRNTDPEDYITGVNLIESTGKSRKINEQKVKQSGEIDDTLLDKLEKYVTKGK